MPNHAQYHTPLVSLADWLICYALPAPLCVLRRSRGLGRHRSIRAIDDRVWAQLSAYLWRYLMAHPRVYAAGVHLGRRLNSWPVVLGLAFVLSAVLAAVAYDPQA